MLRQRLENNTKEGLLNIRKIFDIDVPSSARKAELVDAIEGHFLKRTEEVLRRLPEYELRLLQGLAHLPEGHTYSFEFPSAPYVLDVMGIYISQRKLETRELSISIDNDLREAVSRHIDAIVIEYEMGGQFRAETLFWGILITYGAIHFKDLIDIVLKGGVSEEFVGLFFKRIKEYAPLFFLRHDDYLVNPMLDNPDVLLEDRRKKGFEELKSIPIKEIEDTGMSTPYFASDMKRPHGQKLLDALRDAGYIEEALPSVVSDIWLVNQLNSGAKAFNRLVKSILENGSFRSQREAEKCMNAIVAYSNRIPKWFLGGRSSDEVGKDRDLDARIDASVSATAERLTGIFKQASQFPRVGRNDLCPCGSGLKYKNCHGKNQN